MEEEKVDKIRYPVGKTLRTSITLSTWLLSILLIGGLTTWGNDESVIHRDSLSWGFYMVVTVLAGVGFSTVIHLGAAILEKITARKV